MKLAILGGSFNPVHIGHLFLADAALSGFDYDRVILVPAFQSPFKIGAGGASPRDRLEMLAAAIPGDPRLTIDDCEIRREGVSYTIDTLKDIIARYRPEGKPALILGDDLASAFHKWRSPDEIARLADIIIARRLSEPRGGASGNGGEWACGAESGGTEVFPAGGFPYPYKALNNEIMDVSSSLLREKIRRNENWRYLVPSGARYIIEDRRLYGFGGGSVPGVPDGEKPSETIALLENEVRGVLDTARFTHSRNTALLARDLCLRFGLDPQKGYLAGIVHDICKPLEDDALFRLAHADGKSISKLERKKPGLLHARAAAVLLRQKYGIADEDILEAVRWHTTGKKEMTPLAKIVYVADKIEISRTGTDPGLRELSRSAGLDALFTVVLDNTVAYLRSRRMDISYGTKRLLTAIHKRSIGQ